MSDIQAIREALTNRQLSMSPDGTLTLINEPSGFFTKWRKLGSLTDLLSALSAAEARAEAAEARVLKLLEDYAASIESMSCKEYLVDKLAATGVSANVTLAYGRVQGIRMAADKIRASRTLKGTSDGR